MTDNIRLRFENWYKTLLGQYNDNAAVKGFMGRSGTKQEALALVRNVCKSHLCSPQILSFLYAVTPPNSADHIRDNLLEELGLYDETLSHPDLLRRLGEAAGFSQSEWMAVEGESEQVLKNKISEPIMFGTMTELGLSVMIEVFGFEWFLSRESGNIGKRLSQLLNLNGHDLEWFFHHSEVDVEHAEQGLDTLVDYVNYFSVDEDTLINIVEITMRDNIFLKRYFDLQVKTSL